MKRENISDNWVKEHFQLLIKEACHDFPSDELPTDPNWYFERVDINDMRMIMSTLLINQKNLTVKKFVYYYLTGE